MLGRNPPGKMSAYPLQTEIFADIFDTCSASSNSKTSISISSSSPVPLSRMSIGGIEGVHVSGRSVVTIISRACASGLAAHTLELSGE